MTEALARDVIERAERDPKFREDLIAYVRRRIVSFPVGSDARQSLAFILDGLLAMRDGPLQRDDASVSQAPPARFSGSSDR